MTIRTHSNDLSLSVWILLAIALVSGSLIGMQVVLMRALSIARYHHFSYLVISTALLGFGASGTFLSFFRSSIEERFPEWSRLFFFLFILSFPLSYYLAQSIPVDIQYILYSGRQLLYTSLYNLCLLLPFFFGATLLGMSLAYFRERADTVYGMDLLGSGVGGIVALLAMFFVPATDLPPLLAIVAFLALLCWVRGFPAYFTVHYRHLTWGVLLAGGVIAFSPLVFSPSVQIDQYKPLSQMQRLAAQGDARGVLQKFGPRGRVDVYESDRIHQTLFAGLSADVLPPHQAGVYFNGDLAGTIFRIESSSDAKIMDFTPQSVPYRLLDAPSVLILGEVDGTNVWLARRFGAESITVVQTNPQLVEVLQEDLAALSGGVYFGGDVAVRVQDPRLFLERTDARYDIIHIARSEGMAAGQSGLQSLHESYLLTVEALQRCYELLTDRGMLSFTRGLQSPPRDNLKYFATAVHALERAGIQAPGDHLMVSRNYLAANTILARPAISQPMIQRFQQICDTLLMDQEYRPDLQSLNPGQRNKVPGPQGKSYSYFHHGIKQILLPQRSQFYRSWVYNITPAKDTSPYFFNFFTWRSLDRFMEAYGRQWLQKLELGYVVLVITLMEVSILGVILILLPLVFLRDRWKGAGGKFAVFVHFAGIGMGFMFIEMVAIQQFGKFLGDPVYSAAAVLTSILVFAGGGSLLQRRIPGTPLTRVRIAVTGLVLVGGAYLSMLPGIVQLFIELPVVLRFLVVIIMLIPPAFLLGWIFPAGLLHLERTNPSLIPWAWGINGVASVAASPLAILLSMATGFAWVVITALALYALVGINAIFWDD